MALTAVLGEVWQFCSESVLSFPMVNGYFTITHRLQRTALTTNIAVHNISNNIHSYQDGVLPQRDYPDLTTQRAGRRGGGGPQHASYKADM